MSRTGILIVTHNSAGHIRSCLDAVHRVRRPGDIVLVIDNASDDNIAVDAPTRFIQNRHNAGFAGAVNQGFQILKDEVDAVLLLNPDVVLQGGIPSFEALNAACVQSGLACGRLTDTRGNTQIGFSFRRFPTPLTLVFETLGVNKFWKSNPVNRRYRCLEADHELAQVVDQPAGAMLMIRNDVFLRVGGFDERFHPVWFEDVDFCRRAALEGFRVAYIPQVKGVHAGGHSVLQLSNCNRKRYWYASLMRYSRNHYGRIGRGLVAAGIVAAAVARAFSVVLRLHRGCVKEAAMNVEIARTALVYPKAKASDEDWRRVRLVGAADVRSRVLNEGLPSNENTERTLKRLHAR